VAVGAPMRLYLCCFVFRSVNALTVRTYFNADEYWQSLEVAHVAVFGYGHLTWEWDAAVRGFAHPAIFAAIYEAARWMRVDTVPFLVWAPRFVQAAFAALADVSIARLARRLDGDRARGWALFCTMSCWFHFFCSVRTFSNCMETALSAAAAALWPWQCIKDREAKDGEVWAAKKAATPQRRSANTKSKLTQNGGANRMVALSLAATSCVIRPTAAGYWFPLIILEAFYTCRSSLGDRTRGIFLLLYEALPNVLSALVFSFVTDRLFYGWWAFTTINFFKFNFLNGGSVRYGVHPWHWYLTQGLPTVASVYLPLAALALFVRSNNNTFTSFIALCCIVIGHSIVEHKELRFMMPTLPFILALSGIGLACLVSEMHVTSKFGKREGGMTGVWKSERVRWIFVAYILFTQIPPALYFSMWHQIGSIAVMPFLSNAVSANSTHSGGILFLTPCHQTPYTTHMHNSHVSMRFLECPPKCFWCDDENVSNFDHVDESERFFHNPGAWLATAYGAQDCVYSRNDHSVGVFVERDGHVVPFCDGTLVPSHVVMFNDTYAQLGVKAWLKDWGYRHEADLFHTHFKVDRDMQSRMWVFVRSPSLRDGGRE